MRPRVEDLACSLQRCILHRDSSEALRLHACMHDHGLLAHPSLANPLVVALAQSGSIPLARQAFDQLDPPNASSFDSLITAYVKQGEPHHALSLYRYMQTHTCLHPSIHAYVALLKACTSLRDLDHGCEVHTHIARRGYLETNVFIGSALVDMYAKCGCLLKAQEVFSVLQEKNIVSWTALIIGYVDNGYAEEALHYFDQMELEGVPLDAVTFVCALKACASICDTSRGQVIHAETVKRGLERNVVVGSILVVMYAKGGLLTTAHDVFDRLLDRDVVLWSTLIAAYAEEGLGEEAIHCYNCMQREGVCPDQVIFVSVLKACSSTGATMKGQDVHLEITKKGMECDPFVSNTLIDVYVRCGLLIDAHELLNRDIDRTVVSWNALLAGYVECGHGEEVLGCFTQIQIDNIAADSVTYICAMKACSATGDLIKGYEIHGEIVKQGLDREVAIGSSLVDMYGKCGYLADAHETFNKLKMQDTVSWNALITGYVGYGHGHEAINCMEDMRKEGVAFQAATLVGGLRACGNMRAVNKGQEFHAETVVMGLEISTLLVGSLVDMYVKCSLLKDAQNVFEKLSAKDVVLWNTLLVGLVDHDCCIEALQRFEQMQHEYVCPDDVSFMCSLKACGALGTVNKGREIHSEIVRKGWEGDLFVGNTLVDMYVNGGTLVEAQKVFYKLRSRSIASWNTLIFGYAEQGYESEALKCYEKMHCEGVLADPITLVCSLKACGTAGFIEKGREIHFEVIMKGFNTDVLIGNTLVDMYSKCGFRIDAEDLFDKLLERTVASWNALIVGNVEGGNCEEALCCFEQMQNEGITPDELTFICCLRACGSIGAVHRGQEVNKEVLQRGLESDAFIGNTLIDMYSKSGLLEEAQYVCNNLSVQTVYSWNAIITGYSQQGESEKVFSIFIRMIGDRIDPNAITFVGILNVCNHAGDVGRGHLYYEAMSKDYSIVPTLQHLTCIVDLLGRTGLIDRAVAMVYGMPFHPGLVVWHTVLGACRKWCDLELGRRAFKHAVQLNDLNPATYVCMSNIYADIDTEE